MTVSSLEEYRSHFRCVAMEEVTYCVIGKSKVINKAMTDMGMGRYQWCLFVLCGFGWMADK
jgi:hypothetical protein